MSKVLYLLGRLDEICLCVTALLFFGGWFFLGKDSAVTITSGCIMFASMFAWFFIASFDELVYLSEVSDDDFYDEED